MVGLVIVSHSYKIAEGIKDLTDQVAPTHKGIVCAGGMEDKSIGTDAVRISEAIKQAESGDGVVVLADLGSGIMSAETAIELLEGEDINAKLVDAPIVEGSIAAAVTAACGSKLEEVIAAAEQTKAVKKIN
ncbi:PTS-dependent dihydroxyacetone kinase phosphotransferase subunit DhaM [Butyrivibrio sp. CB08]|uniref:dihydroxyacetone kinase phosphoryl donor subunit DhaM n=1 Tax=Butyrivibrio sp. CB08 TaxID=2364879 RepID=UPI000EA8E6A7|nr:dihydroxyacetone kinase phosphoryl donor subunit DhaM [Butyrivibrio sp. CB08]RKM57463.1 PTS-dependent dihydroxyacetone kinase phosphotransferase subunit DhaM [Butyrivibrio sp. CB08]